MRKPLVTRKFVAALAVAMLTLGAPTTPVQAANTFSSTAAFIASKFVDGKYIEGFTPGKPDWGFSVEGLLQLKGAGYTSSSLAKAIAFNLTSLTNLGTASNPVGFLYAPDKALLVGRAGQHLFACKVFALTATPACKSTLASLKNAVAKNGVIARDAGNTFNYSWATLGLVANGEITLASANATRLASLARADGGYGTDLTADTATSAPDATGIALMAYASVKVVGTSAQLAARKAAVIAAVKWLKKNVIADHFESWGDIDVNGTAYAGMGLSSYSVTTIAYAKYLASRIAPDGGITTPWSTSGDTYATVQGYLALRSMSYLDLIKK